MAKYDLWANVGAEIDDFAKDIASTEAIARRAGKTWQVEMVDKLARPINVKSLLSVTRELNRLQDEANQTRAALLNATPMSQEAVKLEAQLRAIETRVRAVNTASAETRERMSRMFSGMSTAGTGMMLAGGAGLAGIFAGASQLGSYAEQLQNLEKTTGLTTDKLQVLKYYADTAGLSFETIGNAAAMVQQKLAGVEDDSGAAAEAFKRLGIDIHNNDGTLRSMSDLFPELVSRLQGLENATERNMLASQVFGKGWKELAPILGMSADEFARVEEQARKLGLVMSRDSVQAAADFDDAIDALAMTAKGNLYKALSDILPTLQRFIATGTKALQWFADLDPAVKKGAGAIALYGSGVLLLGGGILKMVGYVGQAKWAIDILAGGTAKKTVVTIADTVANTANAASMGAQTAAAEKLTLALRGIGAAAPLIAAIVAPLTAAYFIMREINNLNDATDAQDESTRKQAEQVKRFTENFNEASQAAKRYGMTYAEAMEKARAAGYKSQGQGVPGSVLHYLGDKYGYQRKQRNSGGDNQPDQPDSPTLTDDLAPRLAEAQARLREHDESRRQEQRRLQVQLSAVSDDAERTQLQARLTMLRVEGEEELSQVKRLAEQTARLRAVNDEAQKKAIEGEYRLKEIASDGHYDRVKAQLRSKHEAELDSIRTAADAQKRAQHDAEERDKKRLDIMKSRALAIANMELFRNAEFAKGIEVAFKYAEQRAAQPAVAASAYAPASFAMPNISAVPVNLQVNPRNPAGTSLSAPPITISVQASPLLDVRIDERAAKAANVRMQREKVSLTVTGGR